MLDLIFTFKSKILTTSTIFIASSFISNFLNLLFNAYLGRSLTIEEFGLITFINTLVLVSGIFINAFGTAITHRVAYLATNVGKKAADTFLLSVRKKAILISIGIMILWIIAIPFSSKFFNIADLKSLIYFTPIFGMLIVGILNKGYLSGNLFFIQVSIALIAESTSRLILAILLTSMGYGELAYLSIPASVFVSFALLYFFTSRLSPEPYKVKHVDYAFPRRFFVFAILTGLSTSGFLTLDVVFVKHFLLPIQAGEYSLLALGGKMIFFAGSLFNSLILTFVSRDIGAGINPQKTFNKLVWGTITFTLLSYSLIGLFGSTFMPMIFGPKALLIVQFIPIYAFGIALFTVSTAFVVYHLANHRYSFSILSIISTSLMLIGMFFFHKNIQEITYVIFAVSLINFTGVMSLHMLQNNGKFILRNLIDLFDIFSPIPNQAKYHESKQRILIFNWRDTHHKYAGGAEVYIQELAKRWVKMGNSVTQFCGNDGESARNEVIDGVQIVRRGGFFFVYFWAFIYYVFKFRGKYDVIIDAQNGIPFFTPLYAKEQTYCLMFHVHQEVFRESLPAPIAAFAEVLENRFMPWIYRKVKFITISDSSKKEIESLGLGVKGIEIVYPGIDLRIYKPTNTKTDHPLILYIGRLKLYKSVDILIKASQGILKSFPNAEIVIAGDGEEKRKLKQLAENLGIRSRVKFLGKITEARKIGLYQKAWVAVNPSFKEGWGITTIEANACGTPVVASDVPGLRDSVRNPSTGFLAEYGNEKEFENKILQLINDTKLREYMEGKSIEWAQNFAWLKSAKKSAQIIS